MGQTDSPDGYILSRYLLLWVGMVFVAIFNGIMRGALFEQFLDALAAHQLSSLTLVMMFFIVTWFANKRWRIATMRQALLIGLMWVILTPIFEFTFGMFIMGHPLEYLLADYNLLAGRTWSLVMISIFLLPLVVQKLAKR
jgi:hypothetical protein